MYKVYFTSLDDEICAQEFDELIDALKFSEMVRKQKCRFVTMVSENANVVGESGVDAVENGLLPDGSKYEWMKRRKT